MNVVTDHPPHSSDTSSDPQSDEKTSLSRDDVFHILQTNRRRESIEYLLNEDGPVKMCDVAEHVAARENDTTVADLTSTQRQRVYIPLYQSHLPKLDEVGVIEYDKPRGIVRATERLEVFRPYLDVRGDVTDRPATEPDRSLNASNDDTYYAAAIVVSTVLLATTAAGVLTISGLTLGTIITVLFVLATAATNHFSPPSTNDTAAYAR